MKHLRNACLVLVLAHGGVVGADEAKKAGEAGKGADHQAMMAAYEKASEPADQHKVVLRSVGKWTLTTKSWMDPKQPPMESKGTAEGKAILGDRFVQTNVTFDMMGKPFSGVAINGYDKAKKKFVGTWIDSMSTGIMHSEGSTDATGKIMTVQTVGSDPLTGKENRMRIVGTWETDDKLVEEFFEKKKGKETKMMEITYTRAK